MGPRRPAPARAQRSDLAQLGHRRARQAIFDRVRPLTSPDLPVNDLGAPFVEGIDGDPGNVMGLSLPLLRRMLANMGVAITDLWRKAAATSQDGRGPDRDAAA